MGSFSIWHWLIVLVVVLLLFGRGKIPELAGDFAKGIKNFKKGLADKDDDVADETKPVTDPKVLDYKTADPVATKPQDVNKV
ncbi:twin-arginine translocase TatA/TatE family subunit [Chthonobacter rhizosphaerae]|uniref:twin-arginine translocase TatA/TatE family subunit n=1 Tax=Chthonobacter rhizosphaerae TaxID=2735553 RepID=UPI0015EF194F|nr:twin-arginine translocase TatA/TatE family subunit [Chthonobacter rhizosphaerae]